KRGDKWHSISSAEVVRRAGDIALGLYSIELRPGDRAAIMSANSPEWTLADAGCQLAGFLDVPIYTTLAATSVEYILNDSESRVIFLEDREMYESIADILRNCPSIEKIIFFNITGVEIENALSLSDLELMGAKLRSAEPDLLNSLSSAIDPSDVATL